MSRIGKLPVALPKGVDVAATAGKVTVKGPKGSLELALPKLVKVEVGKDKDAKDAPVVRVSRTEESRQGRAMHGLARALIANMVKGVTVGYEKKLEIHGVGYDAELKGTTLNLKVGFANTIALPVPSTLKVVVTSQSVQGNRIVYISVSGCDKQLVGQFAAAVRAVRPPEPYKQKGVRYADEPVRKKAGKAFAGS